MPQLVHADQYDRKIKALEQKNAAARDSLSELLDKASSYQDAIARLRNQINVLNSAIVKNQARQSELRHQIAEKKAEIKHQRVVLGDVLRSMYVDGQMSTIEMLATSNDLSDYVDKEEYSNSVQGKVQDALAQIAKLEKQLQDEKSEVDSLLAQQQEQQKQLSASKAKQASLLHYNQSQQASFNSKISSNKKKIAKLRAEQAAANARLFAGGGSHIVAGHNGNDTYPNKWRNAAQDSMLDSWGMYNRECVSYTAWKVYESGRHMPYWGGRGNANEWDEDARGAGIPVDHSPRRGDVAIKNSYPYGHAMYVEHVYSDGAIYVSQYNVHLDGTYSEAYLSASTVRSQDLVFIHF